MLDYMAKNNLELTESNLDVVFQKQRSAERSGDFFGTVIKAVTTGDPMAIFGVLTTGIGLLGVGAGKVKAKKYRAKCIEYANMDIEKSQEKLKDDKDFPDIIA
jgi:hypothetical protein